MGIGGQPCFMPLFSPHTFLSCVLSYLCCFESAASSGSNVAQNQYIRHHEIPVAVNSKESFDTSSPKNLFLFHIIKESPPLLYVPQKDKLSSDPPSTQEGNNGYCQGNNQNFENDLPILGSRFRQQESNNW